MKPTGSNGIPSQPAVDGPSGPANADATTDLPVFPEVGRSLFHVKQVPLVERYATLLASEGVVRGLIGPREVPRLWDRHVLNSALMAGLLSPDSTLADIGSGAGLPGMVLAIARPDVQVTLIEPLLRRTTFLAEVVDELGLTNVEVVRGRAEALHGVRTFDVVTSRAVAPLPRLLSWSMPLVAQGGKLLAMKGSNVAEELVEVEEELKRAKCATPVVHTLGSEHELSTTFVLEVAWQGPRSVDWPPTRSSSRVGAPGRTRGHTPGRRR